MSARHPVLRLLPKRARRAQQGHPWVYSNEIAMDAAAKALPPGAAVTLQTAEGAPLGTALFNPHTLIAARIVDRTPDTTLDAAWTDARVASALALRTRLFEGPFYRLIHAEADGLPALIVDRFGDVLVVQPNGAGAERLLPDVLAALRTRLAPRGIVVRREGGARALEGLAEAPPELLGEVPRPVPLDEGGVGFFADPLEGQKTGWFFDQRENRAWAARFGRGGRVLDAYCHTGGFALTALAAGAPSALGLDRSEPALALARAAAEANGFGERAEFRRAEVFDELQRLRDQGRSFDLVIADPPAFAKSAKDVSTALPGYRKLARLAARLVAPGGVLGLCSCSHNIERERFAEACLRGILDARGTPRLVRSAGAGPDHPIHPLLPESAYLKALFFQID